MPQPSGAVFHSGMPTLVVAAFLFAHGAIHAGFISPRPPVTAGGPTWPFDLAGSRALGAIGIDPDVARLLGTALVAVVLGGYALAAVVALGFLPSSIWLPAIVLASAASLGLLVLFFHPWLVLGVAIDAVLLYASLVAGWVPAAGGLR